MLGVLTVLASVALSVSAGGGSHVAVNLPYLNPAGVQYVSGPALAEVNTIHHVPAEAHVPVTSVQAHHGVVSDVVDVAKPAVQTRRFEVRRPAIQKQFYDIEERVLIRPAGSALLELDEPLAKFQKGPAVVHDLAGHGVAQVAAAGPGLVAATRQVGVHGVQGVAVSAGPAYGIAHAPAVAVTTAGIAHQPAVAVGIAHAPTVAITPAPILATPTPIYATPSPILAGQSAGIISSTPGPLYDQSDSIVVENADLSRSLDLEHRQIAQQQANAVAYQQQANAAAYQQQANAAAYQQQANAAAYQEQANAAAYQRQANAAIQHQANADIQHQANAAIQRQANAAAIQQQANAAAIQHQADAAIQRQANAAAYQQQANAAAIQHQADAAIQHRQDELNQQFLRDAAELQSRGQQEVAHQQLLSRQHHNAAAIVSTGAPVIVSSTLAPAVELRSHSGHLAAAPVAVEAAPSVVNVPPHPIVPSVKNSPEVAHHNQAKLIDLLTEKGGVADVGFGRAGPAGAPVGDAGITRARVLAAGREAGHPIGERVNTRRVVVSRPIETVQEFDVIEPATRLERVQVHQPAIFKSLRQDIARVQTSIPVQSKTLVQAHTVTAVPTLGLYH